MNKAVLMGRLTKDPDRKTTDKGMEISRFTLAVDRMKTKNNQDPGADFISIKAFGTLAKFANIYLHKGTKIVLSGRITTGSYTDRDGRKVYTTDVIADEIDFAESKKTEESNQQEAPQGNSDFMSIPDNIEEELPFK